MCLARQLLSVCTYVLFVSLDFYSTVANHQALTDWLSSSKHHSLDEFEFVYLIDLLQ